MAQVIREGIFWNLAQYVVMGTEYWKIEKLKLWIWIEETYFS